jgi:sugar lactone lactonase YvrE
MRLFTTLSLLFVSILAACSCLSHADESARPDLDVTYIERTPLYPAYTVAYDLMGQIDVPILIDPQTRFPLVGAQADAIKRQPAPGEKVTFTAHVVNKGDAPAGEWEYQWFVDDKLAASSVFKQPLKPGEEAAVAMDWKWQNGPHRVRCTVDPQHKIAQSSQKNDSLEVAADAWLLAWAIDRQTYGRFNHANNFVGTRSFEDWAQWHIARMNELFQSSPSPLNPAGGSRVRVACGKIVVVPDIAQPWTDLLPLGASTPIEAGYDGAWAFGHVTDVTKWASAPDWGLIHEWGHQLGLTDENALDRAGAQNLVLDESGDPFLIGRTSSQAGYIMHTPGEAKFSPQGMAALETQYGRRRGYYGDYYFAVPATNILLVLDSAGKPVPNARIGFWQEDEEGVYQGSPAFVGSTDMEGKFVLPDRPAPHVTTAEGFTLHDNPFGQISVTGARDVFFIRITARGQNDYAWLDIADLNMAVWNGNKTLATYPRRTHIPPLGAPRPPDNLRAELTGDTLTLRWNGADGAKGYRVYQSTSEQSEWKPVGSVVTETQLRTELESDTLHRCAVVAIAPDGKESAFSNIAGILRLKQPCAVVVTKGGRRLIRDRQYGQAILQKADGSFVGPAGAASLDMRGANDAVVDSKGRIISTKGAGGAGGKEAPQGFLIQNPDLSEALRVLSSPGSQPQHFQNPTGLAVDSHDNIFLCDTDNDRIQEYGPDGKFKAVIGVGMLSSPLKLALDKHDNLIVCDTGGDRLTVLRRDTDGVYRLHGHANNLPHPVYIIMDAEGRFFVSCEGDNSVIALSSQFYRLPWKFTGAEGFRLKSPSGLALDGKGNLLVVDTGNRRVVETNLPAQ